MRTNCSPIVVAQQLPNDSWSGYDYFSNKQVSHTLSIKAYAHVRREHAQHVLWDESLTTSPTHWALGRLGLGQITDARLGLLLRGSYVHNWGICWINVLRLEIIRMTSTELSGSGKESRWVWRLDYFPTFPPTLRVKEACSILQRTDLMRIKRWHGLPHRMWEQESNIVIPIMLDTKQKCHRGVTRRKKASLDYWRKIELKRKEKPSR